MRYERQGENGLDHRRRGGRGDDDGFSSTTQYTAAAVNSSGGSHVLLRRRDGFPSHMHLLSLVAVDARVTAVSAPVWPWRAAGYMRIDASLDAAEHFAPVTVTTEAAMTPEGDTVFTAGPFVGNVPPVFLLGDERGGVHAVTAGGTTLARIGADKTRAPAAVLAMSVHFIDVKEAALAVARADGSMQMVHVLWDNPMTAAKRRSKRRRSNEDIGLHPDGAAADGSHLHFVAGPIVHAFDCTWHGDGGSDAATPPSASSLPPESVNDGSAVSQQQQQQQQQQQHESDDEIGNFALSSSMPKPTYIGTEMAAYGMRDVAIVPLRHGPLRYSKSKGNFFVVSYKSTLVMVDGGRSSTSVRESRLKTLVRESGENEKDRFGAQGAENPIRSGATNATLTIVGSASMAKGSVVRAFKPVASSGGYVSFLTDVGAGTLNVNTMDMTETVCKGVNATASIVAATLDSKLATKAYAVIATDAFGEYSDAVTRVELVTLFVMTNGSSDVKCKVRTRSSLNAIVDVANAQSSFATSSSSSSWSSQTDSQHHFDKLVASEDARYELASTTGYLFLTIDDSVFVFNTTRTGVTGPQFLFHEPLESMTSMVGDDESQNGAHRAYQDSVMRCGMERHLVVAVNSGHDGAMDAARRMSSMQSHARMDISSSLIFVYDIDLPLYPQQLFNPRGYTQPIMMIAILVVGIYQFLRQRDPHGNAIPYGGRGGGGMSAFDSDEPLPPSSLQEYADLFDAGGSLGGMGGDIGSAEGGVYY